MRIRSTFSAAALAAMLISSCNWTKQEPPTPVISTISIGPNEIIKNDSITISWSANLDGCSYRYKFGDAPEAVWDAVPVFDTILSDGSYSLSVQASKDGKESTWSTVPFTIAELDTPTLYITPRHQSASVGDTIAFSICGKHLEPFNAFSFKLTNVNILTCTLEPQHSGIKIPPHGGSVDYIGNPVDLAFGSSDTICNITGLIVTDTPSAEVEIGFAAAELTNISNVEGKQSITKAVMDSSFQSGIVSFTSIVAE